MLPEISKVPLGCRTSGHPVPFTVFPCTSCESHVSSMTTVGAMKTVALTFVDIPSGRVTSCKWITVSSSVPLTGFSSTSPIPSEGNGGATSLPLNGSMELPFSAWPLACGAVPLPCAVSLCQLSSSVWCHNETHRLLRASRRAGKMKCQHFTDWTWSATE